MYHLYGKLLPLSHSYINLVIFWQPGFYLCVSHTLKLLVPYCQPYATEYANRLADWLLAVGSHAKSARRKQFQISTCTARFEASESQASSDLNR